MPTEMSFAKRVSTLSLIFGLAAAGSVGLAKSVELVTWNTQVAGKIFGTPADAHITNQSTLTVMDANSSNLRTFYIDTDLSIPLLNKCYSLNVSQSLGSRGTISGANEISCSTIGL
jgi:hypothetical protein